MILKEQFVKSGEEAFALDAFTWEKLERLGYQETVRNAATGDRMYEKPGVPGHRLVRKASFCDGSIVNFGSIVREVSRNGQWQPEIEVSLETFINEPKPFARPVPAANHPSP